MNKETLNRLINAAIAAGAMEAPTPPAEPTPEGGGPCEGCDCGLAESPFDEALAAFQVWLNNKE